MSHRTQVTLSDAEYRLLKRESERTGASMSELVRRAVSATYGEHRRRTGNGFEQSFGLWKDRDIDPVEYVKQLRGPGLGYRLRG
jgi:Ribbon-helix-helix protein, copG family